MSSWQRGKASVGQLLANGAFGALRRQRNDIEYPRIVSAQLTSAESAVGLAQQLTEAAQELLPNLGLFRS
jgi:hypothetical protein